MMLGTVGPTRHQSAKRISRGWVVGGVCREREGCPRLRTKRTPMAEASVAGAARSGAGF